MSAQCTLPPEGWYCTRAPGHEGPCAAKPTRGKLEQWFADVPDEQPSADTVYCWCPYHGAPVREDCPLHGLADEIDRYLRNTLADAPTATALLQRAAIALRSMQP